MSKRKENSGEDEIFKDFEKKKKKLGILESDKKPKFVPAEAIPEIYGFVLSAKQPKKKGTMEMSKMKFVEISIMNVDKTIKKIQMKEEKYTEKKLSKHILNNNSVMLYCIDKTDSGQATTTQENYKKEENLVKDGNKLTVSVTAGKIQPHIKGGDYVVLKNVLVSNTKIKPTDFWLNCDSVELNKEKETPYLKTKFEMALNMLKKYDKINIEKLTQTKEDYQTHWILPSKSVKEFYTSDKTMQKRVMSTFPTTDNQTHSLRNKMENPNDPDNWKQYVYYVFDVVDIQDRSDPKSPKYKRIKFKFYATEEYLLSRGFPTALDAENILLTHDIPSIYLLSPDVDGMAQSTWEKSNDLMEGPIDPEKENYIYPARVYGIVSRFNEYLMTYGVKLDFKSAIYYLLEKCGSVENQNDYDNYIEKKKDFIIKSKEDPSYLHMFEELDLVCLDTYHGKPMTPFFDETKWALRLLVGGPKQNAKTIKKTCEEDENLIQNMFNGLGFFENLTFSSLLYAVKLDSLIQE